MPMYQQSEVDEMELDVFDHRRRRFQLSARVHLAHFSFEHSFRRQMDNGENTRRLKQGMKIQGCRRLMQNNHVPVIVPQADWNTRVRPRSRDDINFWLDVDPDYQLRAQDHESLVRAALSNLSIQDQWWMADVYVVDEDDDHDSNPDTVKRFFRSLNERFSNDRRPPDGLIYERIRYYEGYLDGPMDEWAAKDWWAMLETAPGSKKGKYLRAFLKHPQFPQRLDSLLVIPGLWGGMRIGLLHKLLAMHCDEPILCYWDLILKTFLNIVGNRPDRLALIDGATVKLLQSRAPRISPRDREYLETKRKSAELFSNASPSLREELWQQLQQIDYPIPTLETFFKDRSYLEVGQSVMKQLYSPDPQRPLTVDQRVCELFDTDLPVTSTVSQQMLGHDLLEFWRFSFQYGFEMTDHQRRKALNQASVESTPSLVLEQSAVPDKMRIWGHFCQIIQSRGFRPPNRFVAAPRAQLPDPDACDFPDIGLEEDVEVEKRSGKPFSNTIDVDRHALSAESLRRSWTAPQVTAGFLRRSVFKAFFSYLIRDGQDFSQALAADITLINSDEYTRDFEYQNADVSIRDAEIMSRIQSTSEPGSSVETVRPQFNTTAEVHQGVVASLNHDPSYFSMRVTIGNHEPRTLYLPNSAEFIRSFQEGLLQHFFNVKEPDGRFIPQEDCYTYYLLHPKETLHAQYYMLEPTISPESNDRNNWTDPIRHRDEERLMKRAEDWMKEVVHYCHQNVGFGIAI